MYTVFAELVLLTASSVAPRSLDKLVVPGLFEDVLKRSSGGPAAIPGPKLPVEPSSDDTDEIPRWLRESRHCPGHLRVVTPGATTMLLHPGRGMAFRRAAHSMRR